ncbi:MAG: ISH6 family transposase [Vicinamibacteria bacterium]
MPKCQLEWSVEWDGPITLAALTERLHQEGAGREDLKALLEERNRDVCDALCGPRYHPDPECEYRRAGTKRRKLGTRFGKIEVRVTRVKHLPTRESFVPLWDDVKIQPLRVYQDDVVALVESGAQRMSYRNTNEELGKTVDGAPSAHTINRRVIEDGAKLIREIHGRELVAITHQPDGTKVHAQRRPGGHHDVNIVLATSPTAPPRLRSLTVGKPWEAHLPAAALTRFETDGGEPVPPTVVSDFEKGLAALFTPEGGYWQPCLVHVVRYMPFVLWDDGKSKSDETDAIVSTVVAILEHLKNSLALHLPKGEAEAVLHRIKQTIKEFRRLATRLWNDGMRKTARFLRRASNSVTTFATLALQGIRIPWHNNLLERLMGEVSKRFKHKWMSWTSHGGQALLSLLVVRTVEPDTYENFWRRKLFGVREHLPDLGIAVTHRRAEC